jgi:hypothetical protein
VQGEYWATYGGPTDRSATRDAVKVPPYWDVYARVGESSPPVNGAFLRKVFVKPPLPPVWNVYVKTPTGRGEFLRQITVSTDYDVNTEVTFVTTAEALDEFTTLRQIQERGICVGPEGLAYQDGWAYFGSLAMAQIKRVNVATGAVELIGNPAVSSKAQFIKIALSDGTAGPRGTVFMAAWGGGNTFLPGGATWTFWGAGSTLVNNGRGGVWAGMGYPTAICAQNGRIIMGSADYGLAEISLAQAADPPKWDKNIWAAGYAEYRPAATASRTASTASASSTTRCPGASPWRWITSCARTATCKADPSWQSSSSARQATTQAGQPPRSTRLQPSGATPSLRLRR